MQCVVPLAGPQLSHPRYGLIAKYPVDGAPLLQRTLTTRRWWRDGRLRPADLTFVLREAPEMAEIRAAVEEWFPGCRIVTLSGLTGGAVLSALAGAAQVTALDEPLVIDLADILYDVDADIEAAFAAPSVGAVVTYFEDSDPCYSYFRFDAAGAVEFAAEKRVISSHASAGTYVFRSTAHYIAAAGKSLSESRDELAAGRALFVCPVVNSIVRLGLTVRPLPVTHVRSVSKLLHAGL